LWKEKEIVYFLVDFGLAAGLGWKAGVWSFWSFCEDKVLRSDMSGFILVILILFAF
jgi:hypothetical protein